ncbi:hypothetical protein FA13DRAFT_1797714 [Coprinellus micaceus]|uniref:Uncharacterized protein n=1 Tax=Coprinellus micaceus TaxID=71717 RepID=A0A4Y7SRG2_COPMI|nr:hypothetical protein FA13DRAFT_1797714 [Coprinellus micaceus]
MTSGGQAAGLTLAEGGVASAAKTQKLCSPHPGKDPCSSERINLLPEDVLTEIFRLCLPSASDTPPVQPPSPHTAPLLLCHVCSYWRRQALATPQLWWHLSLGEVRPPTIKRSNPQAISSMQSDSHHANHPSVSVLALQSMARFFVDIIRPHHLRSITLKASRYRRDDLKTEWERKTRGWVIERGPGNFQLMSGKALLKSVLSMGDYAVARGLRELSVSLDDMEDFSMTSVTLVRDMTSQIQVLPSRSLESLQTLRLYLPGLEIYDIERTFPSLPYSTAPSPALLWMEIWAMVSLTRSAWISFAGYSGLMDHASRASWTRQKGLVRVPFSHTATVPKLHTVYSDIPWILLIPGRYASFPLAMGWTSSAGLILHDISIFPYSQLTNLEIALDRPIPTCARDYFANFPSN